MKLSAEVRHAQLETFAQFCNGGAIEVLEKGQILARFPLPTPAFTQRKDGIWVGQPAPEENAKAGTPGIYVVRSANGAEVARGIVGDDLTVTPSTLRDGTRVVCDPITLGLENT